MIIMQPINKTITTKFLYIYTFRFYLQRTKEQNTIRDDEKNKKR